MTRAFATASLLFCLSSVLAAQLVSPPPPPPAAQSDTPPDKSAPLSGPATFSISGIVVSATTGTPLDRAEVSLSTSSPASATQSPAIPSRLIPVILPSVLRPMRKLAASPQGKWIFTTWTLCEPLSRVCVTCASSGRWPN